MPPKPPSRSPQSAAPAMAPRAGLNKYFRPPGKATASPTESMRASAGALKLSYARYFGNRNATDIAIAFVFINGRTVCSYCTLVRAVEMLVMLNGNSQQYFEQYLSFDYFARG